MKNLPNLLIVDDSKINLFLLETVIKKIAVNLIQALSGVEALEKTHGIELALAIIDVQMPGMNGYELALKINAERLGDKVPVIFLTASHNHEMDIFKGYSSGAVDYIYKPVHNHILQSKINVFLDIFNQRQKIIADATLLQESADKLIRVNAELKKSERRLIDITFSMADWVWEVNEKGVYTFSSENGSNLLGVPQEEIIGKTPFDFMPLDEAKRVAPIFADIMAKRIPMKNIENWNLRNNGERICLLTNGVPIFDEDGGLKGYRGVDKNITVQKLTEQMLENKVNVLNETGKMAKVGGWELDVNSGIQTWTDEIYRILEIDLQRDEPILTDSLNFYTPTSRPIIEIARKNAIDYRQSYDLELEIITAKGNKRWVHTAGKANQVNGHTNKISGVIQDITDRKLAELAMKESEEKYRTLLNASPDGILLVDLKGIITEVSEIGLELFGGDTKKDLVGKAFTQVVPYDEKNTARELIEKTMYEGFTQNIGLKFKKKNQTIFAGETSSTLIQGSDGTPLSFMITVRDISQRKKLETKQIHADRMANIGQMAAGIAHEINQPLNIISLVMDKILFESAKNNTIDIEFFKNKSDKIFENIIRIRNIIDHIRAFSRSHDDYILTAFDINTSIENATSMIMEQFKHLGISLNLQLEKHIPLIVGNTFKFEQVIINLVSNAKDAVMEKKSRQKDNFEMIVGIRTFSLNQSLIIEVTDNGIGIGDDDIHNIILPFYTTKEEGKGTGLGLSICYQIIKEMSGMIEISSDCIKGTKIRIVLEIQKKK